MWKHNAHGRPFAYLIALGVFALATAPPAEFTTRALAQQSRPAAQQNADAPRDTAPSGEAGARPGRANEKTPPRLPPDSTTDHTMEVAGRTLAFKAVAGSIPLNDPQTGNVEAEIAFVSFVVSDPNRPVTFLFNGGPGAASAYLNIGAVGPWRVPFDGISPSATPGLVANAETWLGFTDLVFIDPVMTGYSRIVAGGDSVRRNLLSMPTRSPW
jgi:carboxypeptidase C (cathepsin A)